MPCISPNLPMPGSAGHTAMGLSFTSGLLCVSQRTCTDSACLMIESFTPWSLSQSGDAVVHQVLSWALVTGWGTLLLCASGPELGAGHR